MTSPVEQTAGDQTKLGWLGGRTMKSLAMWLGLDSREGLALLCALGVVFLVSSLSYRGWTAFDHYASQVETTQAMASQTSALLILLTDAETGQRGFLLTGRRSYLDPYQRALRQIPLLFQSLKKAAQNRPDHAQRIKRLEPVVREKLAELALAVELRRSKGIDAALEVVRTDRGMLLMVQARQICAEMQAATNSRLVRASREARENGDEGGLTSIIGCAGLFA